MKSSSIVIETIESQALRDNALGDPHNRPLPIYLPPGYEDKEGQFPTAYLLAGFASTGFTFLNQLPWEEDIRSRLDRLIQSGDCKPMIVVMPDCFTRYGGSQYLDSPATGLYQSYLLEIVDYVDTHFHTFADRNYRAILGKSSGGYGALMTAMGNIWNGCRPQWGQIFRKMLCKGIAWTARSSPTDGCGSDPIQPLHGLPKGK
jgi:enterochelin esterase-like enzyme